MPYKISIIGTGYVGLTVGLCLAKLGNKVICVDKNQDKIAKLQKGKILSYFRRTKFFKSYKNTIVRFSLLGNRKI
jgi:UDP-glucose 6-dehydrogenase